MISKKEVINCFFYQALISIKNEKEVPNFNIVFNSNINDLISGMNIDTSYIDISKNSDKAFPTMYIEDSNLFFDYLTNIINSLIELRHFIALHLIIYLYVIKYLQEYGCVWIIMILMMLFLFYKNN